ncbi:hypothetical protein OC861_002204 [Tilletia horrida]|nr:hypothetical protein OC845_002038 [Tilletia horrida]KAK0568185.1 hypothetical protein OC861_002204 [Tilletia horrida]
MLKLPLIAALGALLASSVKAQDASTTSVPGSEVLLPILVFQGTGFATQTTASASSTSTQEASTASITGSILGVVNSTTTYAVACAQTTADPSCPIPSGAQFTLTAASSAVNQSYSNTQLELVQTQACSFSGSTSVPTATAVLNSTVPTAGACTIAMSGLPPSHSNQTFTVSIADAARYYQSVSVVNAADFATTPTTSTTIIPVVSTAPAVTSTSFYYLPPVPTTVVTATVPVTTSRPTGAGISQSSLLFSTSGVLTLMACLSATLVLGVVAL